MPVPVFYRNKKTKRRVSIVQKSPAGVKVEYAVSQNTYWYNKEDFNRIFEKIK